MESEVIRGVNDVLDRRPVPPPSRSTAGPVTNGSYSNGSGNGTYGSVSGNGTYSNGSSINGQQSNGTNGNATSSNGTNGNGTNGNGSNGNGATPSIADRFADLLAPLSNRRRRGLIARLSVGYYEGWRPSRAEVNELVAEELRRSPR